MQIVASDFEKDRALSVNGKNYCQKCRKEAPVPATTAGARAPSSDRVSVKSGQTGSRVLDAITPPPSARKVVTPPPRRSGSTPPPRKGGTTRIRKPAPPPPAAPNRTPLIVGAAIGVVVLLGIIAMMTAGGDPPKDDGGNKKNGAGTSSDNGTSTQNPPDVTPKETEDQKLWKGLQAYDQARPGEPREVRGEFSRKRDRITDPELKKLVDDRIAELDAQIKDLDLDEKLADVLYDINQLTPEEHLPKIVELLAAAEEHVAGGAERRKKVDAVKADMKSRLDSILPRRLSDLAGEVRDHETDKEYWTAISLVKDLVVFLEAAQTFTDTTTEQGQWTDKLKQLEKLAEDETSRPDPKPREPTAGAWQALFDGKNFADWTALDGSLFADGDGWKHEDGALRGARSKDGKGQFGVGIGRPDTILEDFDLEIEVEVTRGTLYLGLHARMTPNGININAVPIGPKGGRKTVTVRVHDDRMTMSSPAMDKPVTERIPDGEGSVLLLMDEGTEAKVHSIRWRPLE